MTLDEYQTFCASLPAATHVVQWGGNHVWKVGGKVFAIGGVPADAVKDEVSVSFKCTEIAYEVLRDTPGCRPAPYLASRGAPWIQRFDGSGVDDDELKGFLQSSYTLIGQSLTKRLQRELGLLS